MQCSSRCNNTEKHTEIALCLNASKKTPNSPIGFQNKGWPTIGGSLIPNAHADSTSWALIGIQTTLIGRNTIGSWWNSKRSMVIQTCLNVQANTVNSEHG